MPAGTSIRVNPSRRRLIFTGIAGATIFGAARWLRPAQGAAAGALSADAVDVMRAIIPAFRDGALPDDATERRAAVEETLSAVDTAISGLPPTAREELASLFALLAFAPVRMAFAAIDVRWRDASLTTTSAFLLRLQKSRWSVKRTAYDALHQLTFAAWYANARTWPSIGYPGPPVLA